MKVTNNAEAEVKRTRECFICITYYVTGPVTLFSLLDGMICGGEVYVQG
jgi:hypothetical protein